MAGLALIALMAALAASGPASAARGGSGILGEIERGERSCSDLSDDDFDAAGEVVMGRMLPSRGAHESMDELIARMMGRPGLERMHQALGRRFAGCGGSGLPGGLGAMMGGLGMIGGGPGLGPMGSGFGLGPMGPFGGGEGGSGDRGDGFRRGFGPAFGARPLSFERYRDDDDDAAWIALGAIALLVAGAGGAYALSRRRAGSPPSPGDELRLRLARGEITIEDYERRRHLLHGSV